jgi:hypothetical protein
VKVRHPAFDFVGVDPVWASDAPLVHWVNAIGIIPAYVEPFLIKVMQRARPLLDPVADAELLSDLDVFQRQEAQHFKFHVALNGWIRDGGYPGMADHERAFAREYDAFLETKPLGWLLGYCEGFESMGLAIANVWVDGGLETSLPDADPRPIALWRWHLAEEYEHRTVAFRVLKALYGQRRLRFYRMRLAGLFHAARHIGQRVRSLHTYLIESDAAAAGAPVDRRARRPPKGDAFGRPLQFLPKLLGPRYDPQDARPPVRLAEALALSSTGLSG